jgi:hypothetical protein
MLFDIGTIPASSAVGVKAEQSISNRTVNGIICAFDVPATVAKTSLQVELQNSSGEDGENVILIPEMQMLPFVERADVQFGCGYGDTFSEQAVAATGSTPTTDIPRLAAYIKLGRINLTGDDKLIVRVKVATTFAATDGCRVLGLDTGPGPENILRFVEKPAGDAVFSDCEEAWLYRTSGDADDRQMSALTLGAVTVVMRTPNGAFNYDVRDAWDATRALGRIEANGTRRTALLYDDTMVSAPGASVSVTLGGTNATEKAAYSIIGVERYTNLNRAKRVNAAVRAELKSRLEKLGSAAPDKLDALILQGKVASPRAL